MLIEKIIKQTFRASEIVNNLLNFSRIGSAQFSEVNMNSVVEETLLLVSHPFKTARVEVVRKMQEELPPVLGSNRLQQVFLNLFMNARRHALRRNSGNPHGVLERHSGSGSGGFRRLTSANI